MSRDAHLTLRIGSDKKKALEGLASSLEVTTGQLVRKAVDQLLADRVQDAARVYSVRQQALPGGSDANRVREWAWIEGRRAELESLRGRWIVVEGEELVAHGTDAPAVVAEARRLGVEVPFLQWLPPTSQEGSWMGL